MNTTIDLCLRDSGDAGVSRGPLRHRVPAVVARRQRLRVDGGDAAFAAASGASKRCRCCIRSPSARREPGDALRRNRRRSAERRASRVRRRTRDSARSTTRTKPTASSRRCSKAGRSNVCRPSTVCSCGWATFELRCRPETPPAVVDQRSGRAGKAIFDRRVRTFRQRRAQRGRQRPALQDVKASGSAAALAGADSCSRSLLVVLFAPERSRASSPPTRATCPTSAAWPTTSRPVRRAFSRATARCWRRSTKRIASGCRSRASRRSCATRSSPTRTTTSTSITAWTSAASCARRYADFTHQQFPRRVDDHAAARAPALSQRPGLALAQDSRGAARHRDRALLHQGRDSRALSQHHLSRCRRLRRGRRGAHVLRNQRRKARRSAQAAMLAGVVAAPSDYSPFANLDWRAIASATCCDRMVESGYITQDAGDRSLPGAAAISIPSTRAACRATRIRTSRRTPSRSSRSLFGTDAVEEGGLQVYTTLDPRMQQLAQEAVDWGVHAAVAEGIGAHQAALVAIRPCTGEILAMIGGTGLFADQSIQSRLAGAPPARFVVQDSTSTPRPSIRACRRPRSSTTRRSRIRWATARRGRRQRRRIATWARSRCVKRSRSRATSWRSNSPSSVGLDRVIEYAHRMGVHVAARRESLAGARVVGRVGSRSGQRLRDDRQSGRPRRSDAVPHG